MYRKQDLQYLQDIFDRQSNDIAILYGTKDVGLSELVNDLIKDKECLYYKTSAVIESVGLIIRRSSRHIRNLPFTVK